jgi:hypothetical protein
MSMFYEEKLLPKTGNGEEATERVFSARSDRPEKRKKHESVQ